MYAGRGNDHANARCIALSQQAGMPSSIASQTAGQRLPLAQSLLVYGQEDAEPPPPQLLKKFIAYARAYVHPQLSDGARQACKSYSLPWDGCIISIKPAMHLQAFSRPGQR